MNESKDLVARDLWAIYNECRRELGLDNDRPTNLIEKNRDSTKVSSYANLLATTISKLERLGEFKEVEVVPYLDLD